MRLFLREGVILDRSRRADNIMDMHYAAASVMSEDFKLGDIIDDLRKR